MPNTDHARPGVQVAVYNSRQYDPTATIHTVDRRTATQIVLDNGHRYRVRDGSPVAADRSGRELLPYNDPAVVNARARAAAQDMSHRLEKLSRPGPQRAPWSQMDVATVKARLDEIAAVVDEARRAVGVIVSYSVTGTTPDQDCGETDE